jgi:hypothetical protein
MDKPKYVCLAFLLCAAVGCWGRPEQAIVGKWQASSTGETMEFFPDGTCTMGSTMGSMSLNVAGTYKFIARDKIKLELGGLAALAGPLVVTASVTGDELTWTMPNGKTATKYRRVK